MDLYIIVECGVCPKVKLLPSPMLVKSMDKRFQLQETHVRILEPNITNGIYWEFAKWELECYNKVDR